jgi:hypothetical protein
MAYSMKDLCACTHPGYSHLDTTLGPGRCVLCSCVHFTRLDPIELKTPSGDLRFTPKLIDHGFSPTIDDSCSLWIDRKAGEATGHRCGQPASAHAGVSGTFGAHGLDPDVVGPTPPPLSPEYFRSRSPGRFFNPSGEPVLGPPELADIASENQETVRMPRSPSYLIRRALNRLYFTGQGRDDQQIAQAALIALDHLTSHPAE